MQQNQSMPGAVQPMGTAGSNVSVGGPTFNSGPSMVEGKGGKKTGWILGLVFLLILAAGGIGFGVWAYMDGNAQKDALNTQISSLKQQNNSLQEQLTEMTKQDEVTVFWPASLVHSDKKIYMINESDEVIAALESPVIIQDMVGCSQTISEDGADEVLTCVGTSNTGEEFSFSYNTSDGTFALNE